MSGTGESTTDFAGEERAFRIRLGEIRRIESKCGAGIGEVVRRLSRAVLVTSRLAGIEAMAAGLEIHADDVREVIHQGLTGAGMSSADATLLVRREIDDRGFPGLRDNIAVALEVLWGSQETPDPGEDRAGTGESPATPPSPSTSPNSTASEPSSA